MWRLAVLVSALTVIPSLAAAQQPCTVDARQVIEQVYRQVLERSADPSASVWLDQLSRGATVREIVRAIAKSQEHLRRVGSQDRDDMVVDVYRHLLNRGPDPEAIKSAGILASMRGSASLIDQIIDSPEYRQRFGDWSVPGSSVRYCAAGEPGSRQARRIPRGRENTQQRCTADARQVVEQVYRQVLERSADPSASVWLDQLNRGATVREIVRAIAKSQEHLRRVGSQDRDDMVVDVYRHLLNRGPDPEAIKSAGILASMRGSASLIDQIIDSPEYRQRFGDWSVPGSSVRYCASGEQDNQ
jgi:phycobilisome linker polypeptide/uncharacterized protein DUF4214